MTSNLVITPLRANLSVPTQSPYLAFTAGSQQVTTQTAAPGPNGITWKDIVELDLNGTEQFLNVNVFDQGFGGEGNYVAHAKIPIQDIFRSNDGEGEFNLFNKTGNVGTIFLEWLRTRQSQLGRPQVANQGYNPTMTESYYPEVEYQTVPQQPPQQQVFAQPQRRPVATYGANPYTSNVGYSQNYQSNTNFAPRTTHNRVFSSTPGNQYFGESSTFRNAIDRTDEYYGVPLDNTHNANTRVHANANFRGNDRYGRPVRVGQSRNGYNYGQSANQGWLC